MSLLKSLESQVKKRLPKVFHHLQAQEVQIAMPFTPFLMTIFSCGTPHAMAVRIMDMFLVEGEHVLFILVLRMLALKESHVLELQGEVRTRQRLYAYLRQKLVLECFDEFSMQLLLTPLSQPSDDRELAVFPS